MGFNGYRRPDGKCGVRNHVAVISTVVCANGVVSAIARAVPEVKPIMHTEGCGRSPADVMTTVRTLLGLANNPNVAAILLVGLGCEFVKPEMLLPGLKQSGKPVEALLIQDEGGSVKTARKGISIVRRLVEEAKKIQREPCEWSELILGLECGGSDSMSGVSANPMVGVASDWLVAQGGTVLLTETTEMIGTDPILAARSATPQVGEQIKTIVQRQWKMAQEALGPMAHMVISPGNMEGGLSSIQEKSLGCIVKGGTTAIQQVIEYADVPKKKGLVIMDAPGSDIFSMTALVAGGAQMVVFTTGRGTPAGFPLAPVVKISSTTDLYERMLDDMDLDAGTVLSGETIAKAGERLIRFLAEVAEGKLTKAEINQNDLLAIHTVGPSF